MMYADRRIQSTTGKSDAQTTKEIRAVAKHLGRALWLTFRDEDASQAEVEKAWVDLANKVIALAQEEED
jgi:hypothetical protein